MREGSLENPTRHPLDWQNPDFTDTEKLDHELRRVFDICHGCRRCFNLCDSFPQLFDMIDASATGELESVKSADFRKVADACTLCDMCFMTKCPYVPPHEFDLDFPHLMLRYRIAQAKDDGVDKRLQALTATDINGEAAKYVAPLANWATATGNKITRPILEKTMGVDRRAVLPKFFGKTFVARAKNSPLAANQDAPAFGKRKAVLYATCSVNYNNPAIGMDARAILAHNGILADALYPSCCGMPQLEQGLIESVVAKAAKVAQFFAPYVAEGYDIVALTPSCSLMLKNEWPLLVPKDHPAHQAVLNLAKATFDISEYIVLIAKTYGLAPGLKPLPVAGPVSLHIACHARAQNMGQKAAELLRLIPEAKIDVTERCSGHGGSWGIMKDHFDTAMKVGKPAMKQMAKTNPAYIASECPLAASHLAQGIGELDGQKDKPAPETLNPIEIFARAYGLKGA